MHTGVRAAVLILTTSVLGCRPLCLNVRKDLIVFGTPATGADVVLQVAKEHAPCQPRAQFKNLPFPAGTITWRESAWNDGLGTVAGTSRTTVCVLDIEVLRLEPAPKSALAHEVGHWFWHWCYGRVGETTTNGRRTPDADLGQWIDEVNAEALRRMVSQP